jgi:hypothetical protein
MVEAELKGLVNERGAGVLDDVRKSRCRWVSRKRREREKKRRKRSKAVVSIARRVGRAAVEVLWSYNKASVCSSGAMDGGNSQIGAEIDDDARGWEERSRAAERE